MHKLLITLTMLVAAFFTSAAPAQNNKNSSMETSKVLVAYFSATGTTARVAQDIAAVTSGDLYPITPESAYTAADLDWTDKKSRSSVEMNDPKARPGIKGPKCNMADYDVVFIGYPIWWDLAPRIINTFIESHDLKGKTVIPFATSGGSGISNSVSALKKAYPELDWRDGKLLNRPGKQAIREWVEKQLPSKTSSL